MMTYDDFFAERIERLLKDRGILYETKRMMGGLCFLVEQKMCCGIHFHKKISSDVLLARIGEIEVKKSLSIPGIKPMDLTGKQMKDFILIEPEQFDEDADLEKWIHLCLAFNPQAKKSRK